MEDLSFGLGYHSDQASTALRFMHWSNEQDYLQSSGQPTGQQLENTNLSINSKIWLSENWLIKPKLSWQKNERIAGTGFSFRDLNASTKDLDITLDRFTARLSGQHHTIKGWRGEWGYESIYKKQSVAEGDLVPAGHFTSHAFYAYEEKTFDHLNVQLGIRQDFIRQKPKNTAFSHIDDTRTQSWSALSGSLGLNYSLNPNLKIVSHIARGFRAPSLFDLFADGVHGGVAAIQQGNPELEAEYALNLDLGVRFQTEHIAFSLTGFYNQVDDYIYLRNETPGGNGQLPIYKADQTDATLKGLEMTWDWMIHPQLSLQSDYAFIRGKMEPSGNELPLLPADNLALRLKYHPERFLGLQAPEMFLQIKHYWDKAAAGPYEPFAQFDQIAFGTASTDDYDLWSAGTRFSLPTQTDHALEVHVQINNLLNTSYRDFLSSYKGYTLGEGRSLNLSLNLAF